MSAFLRWLTNRYVLFGLSVVLLLVLVVVLGAWLDWSALVQVVLGAAVLLVCMTVLLVSVLRAQRHAGEIEGTIRAQADRQARAATPDQQEEVERLQQKMVQAIETLKTSKVGQARGKAALYALPWYLIIGPPATGKTSAILNSGLRFPLGLDRVRGVGGTRDCDWFFTDQAILLDTAGRYMTEPEDEAEWLGFLDVLRKHRRRQPINGVIVATSLAELAEMTPEQVEEHAAAARARIDELVRHLKTRFPVYLLFTKADLLQGFVEFFDDLPREEREQVWGATMDPEDMSGGVEAAFEREFDRLGGALVERRTLRLGAAETAEERSRVYLFPLEFAAMRPVLSHYVRELLQPNPYQENPDFRGFYLTSGTQEGAPLDQVGQAVADAFDLPPGLPEGHDPDRETQSYFITRLFTDVVVPDRYRARSTTAGTTRSRALRVGVTAASLVLLVLFTIGAGRAALLGADAVTDTAQAARAVQAIRWSDAGPEALAATAALRDRIDRLDARERALGWGLDRSDELLPGAVALYEDKARAFVAHEPYQTLLSRLRRASMGPAAGIPITSEERLSRADRDTLYTDLRAFVLLTSEHERAGNDGNPTFLKRYLADAAGVQTSPMPPEGTPERAQIDLIAAYVDGLAGGRLAPMDAVPTLVEQVRTSIYEPPSVERAYARIKEEAEVVLPPLTLSEMLQGRYAQLFATQPSVPGFFTLTGWETYARDAIAAEAEQPNRLDWVMGYAAEDLPASMRNEDELAQALEQLYFDEYAIAWGRFLQSVRVSVGGDVSSAARGLVQLGDAYESPLLYILAQATIQTRFDEGTLDQVRARAAQAGAGIVQRQARRRMGRAGRALDGVTVPDEQPALHPVSERFQWLHRLDADKAQSGGARASLTGALQSLAQVGSELEGFAGQEARAAEYARSVVARGGGPMAQHLQEVRGALAGIDRQVRDGLFVAPLLGAWESVAQAATAHVAARWQEDVVQPYQASLADRYPLDFTSSQGASLNEFAAFFAPGDGRVAQFRDEVVAPLLERGRPRAWQGVGVAVPSNVLRAIADAERIGEGLFQGGVLQQRFELQPDLPLREEGAPAVGQVYIGIHGSSASYRMGNVRPWTDFVWPGRPDAVLRVSTRGSELEPLVFQGDWAWVRLFDAATIRARSSTLYDVSWPVGSGVTVQYDLRTPRENSPVTDPRAFFRFQPR